MASIRSLNLCWFKNIIIKSVYNFQYSFVSVRSGIDFSPTWQQWFTQNIFLLGALGLTGVFSVVALLLLCIHVYLASVNTTTWEFMSRHRILYLKHCDTEDNPFDRGVMCNLWDFFCICGTVAWERIYIRNTNGTVWKKNCGISWAFYVQCNFWMIGSPKAQ